MHTRIISSEIFRLVATEKDVRNPLKLKMLNDPSRHIYIIQLVECERTN